MNKSRNRTVIASMKTNLIGLAIAAVSLTSFVAFADDWDDDDGNDNGVQVSVGWNQNAPCDYDHEAVPVFINQAPMPPMKAILE